MVRGVKQQMRASVGQHQPESPLEPSVLTPARLFPERGGAWRGPGRTVLAHVAALALRGIWGSLQMLLCPSQSGPHAGLCAPLGSHEPVLLLRAVQFP